MLLDVAEQGTNAADSLINTFNLSNYLPSDQIWLDLYFKKQSPVPALGGNHVWIRGNDQAAWIPVKSLSDPLDPAGRIYQTQSRCHRNAGICHTRANHQQQLPGEMRLGRKNTCCFR